MRFQNNSIFRVLLFFVFLGVSAPSMASESFQWIDECFKDSKGKALKHRFLKKIQTEEDPFEALKVFDELMEDPQIQGLSPRSRDTIFRLALNEFFMTHPAFQGENPLDWSKFVFKNFSKISDCTKEALSLYALEKLEKEEFKGTPEDLLNLFISAGFSAPPYEKLENFLYNKQRARFLSGVYFLDGMHSFLRPKFRAFSSFGDIIGDVIKVKETKDYFFVSPQEFRVWEKLRRDFKGIQSEELDLEEGEEKPKFNLHHFFGPHEQKAFAFNLLLHEGLETATPALVEVFKKSPKNFDETVQEVRLFLKKALRVRKRNSPYDKEQGEVLNVIQKFHEKAREEDKTSEETERLKKTLLELRKFKLQPEEIEARFNFMNEVLSMVSLGEVERDLEKLNLENQTIPYLVDALFFHGPFFMSSNQVVDIRELSCVGRKFKKTFEQMAWEAFSSKGDKMHPSLRFFIAGYLNSHLKFFEEDWKEKARISAQKTLLEIDPFLGFKKLRVGGWKKLSREQFERAGITDLVRSFYKPMLFVEWNKKALKEAKLKGVHDLFRTYLWVEEDLRYPRPFPEDGLKAIFDMSRAFGTCLVAGKNLKFLLPDEGELKITQNPMAVKDLETVKDLEAKPPVQHQFRALKALPGLLGFDEAKKEEFLGLRVYLSKEIHSGPFNQRFDSWLVFNLKFVQEFLGRNVEGFQKTRAWLGRNW